MKFGYKMLKPVIYKHTANMNENIKFFDVTLNSATAPT